jgi:hypothetical protein
LAVTVWAQMTKRIAEIAEVNFMAMVDMWICGGRNAICGMVVLWLEARYIPEGEPM